MHRMDYLNGVKLLVEQLGINQWSEIFINAARNGSQYPVVGAFPVTNFRQWSYKLYHDYEGIKDGLPQEIITSFDLENVLSIENLSNVAASTSEHEELGKLFLDTYFEPFLRFLHGLSFLARNSIRILEPKLPDEDEIFSSVGSTHLYFRLLSNEDTPHTSLEVAEFLRRLDQLFKAIAEKHGLEYEGSKIVFVDTGSFPLDWIFQLAPEIVAAFQNIGLDTTSIGKIIAISKTGMEMVKGANKAYLWTAKKLEHLRESRENRKQRLAQSKCAKTWLELDPLEKEIVEFASDYEVLGYTKESVDKIENQNNLTHIIEEVQMKMLPQYEQPQEQEQKNYLGKPEDEK